MQLAQTSDPPRACDVEISPAIVEFRQGSPWRRRVARSHFCLVGGYCLGVGWGILPQNIVSRVSPPRVASTEIEIMREDDIRVVLDKLRGRTLYPIASLALATGMRRGELLALRWQDVDLDGCKLRVEQSLEQTKASMRFKSPKTKNGRRTISLPATTVAELRDHWKAQQEFRLSCGLGRSPDDTLVFQTPEGRPRSQMAACNEGGRTGRGHVPRATPHPRIEPDRRRNSMC